MRNGWGETEKKALTGYLVFAGVKSGVIRTAGHLVKLRLEKCRPYHAAE